jgi:hypothetical protein
MLQEGGKGGNPDELTKVSDSGARVRPTHLQLEVRRGTQTIIRPLTSPFQLRMTTIYRCLVNKNAIVVEMYPPGGLLCGNGCARTSREGKQRG